MLCGWTQCILRRESSGHNEAPGRFESNIDEEGRGRLQGTANGGRAPTSCTSISNPAFSSAGALRRYDHRAGTDTGGLQ
jgi:hypothetical protein